MYFSVSNKILFFLIFFNLKKIILKLVDFFKMREIIAVMKNNDRESILLKGSEVVKMLGLGGTAGYRLLKHWDEEGILKPVRLPAIKTARYRRDEVLALCENKEVIPCREFSVN